MLAPLTKNSTFATPASAEPLAVMLTVVPAAKAVPARARAKPEESNVIDITEAEIHRTPDALVETGTGLRIPQARPFNIPPPNVRVL